MISRDLQRILEGKRALRRRLAALPIAEKLRLLDTLRERTVDLRSATRPPSARVHETPPPPTPS